MTVIDDYLDARHRALGDGSIPVSVRVTQSQADALRADTHVVWSDHSSVDSDAVGRVDALDVFVGCDEPVLVCADGSAYPLGSDD